MAMLGCVSWHFIAVYVEYDLVKQVLTGGNAVVLWMVNSKI